ncbi:MAG: methyl-accepting chemotaxis protein [Lentisphaeraceae bacterium]|nr:methyl-accepting chemotaxis protein [Lentisphaeraceae bacterium]
MKDMKILSKLMISTFALIIMMITIAVIYNNAGNVTSEGYSSLISNELKIEDSALKVSNSMLMLRRHEKDFLLRLNLKYQEKHDKEMAVLLKEARNIQDLAKKSNLKDIETKAKAIIENANHYKENFTKLVASWQKRGLTHSEGLQGDFRAAVHNLETELKKLKADKLEIQMLSIRRSEKDYLLRYQDPASAEKYTKKTNDKAAALRTSINSSDYSPELKESLNSLIENYEKGFNSLVAENGVIKNLIAEMRADIHKIDPLISGDEKNKGIIAITEDVVSNTEKTINETVSSNKNSARLIAAAAVILGVLLAFTITRSITSPLSEVVTLAEGLANGDLTKKLNMSRKDEIGQLSRAIDTAVGNLNKNLLVIRNNSNTLSGQANDLHKASDVLSGNIQNIESEANQVLNASKAMSSNMGGVNAQTSEIASVSEDVLNKASSVAENMTTVASAIEESQISVSSIAAASEQMSATITEIAENTERCRSIANDAVTSVSSASNKVNELSAASTEIEKVIDMIVEISEQTKNLALNATIEAARAGEAGKGFAVVANEVKELAKQTSDATVEIRGCISKMTQCSDETVGEIGQINGVINEVRDIVNTISAAIEEQSITVQDNSKNTSQAAEGMLEVTKNVALANAEVSEIAKTISSVNKTISEISSKCHATNQESDNVLNSIQVIENSIGSSTANSLLVSTSSTNLNDLADSLDQLLHAFKVTEENSDVKRPEAGSGTPGKNKKTEVADREETDEDIITDMAALKPSAA